MSACWGPLGFASVPFYKVILFLCPFVLCSGPSLAILETLVVKMFSRRSAFMQRLGTEMDVGGGGYASLLTAPGTNSPDIYGFLATSEIYTGFLPLKARKE